VVSRRSSKGAKADSLRHSIPQEPPMPEQSCIFCKIIKNELPASVIFQDGDVIVIKDIAPKAPIHYLVIPKLHVSDLLDHQVPTLMSHMITAVQKLVAQDKLPASFRTVVNTGSDAGQIVFHLHMHLLAGKTLPHF